MTSSETRITLYKQAKAGLKSLFVQIAQVFLGLIVMLMATGGNPPGWMVSASFILGVGFVALSERKRQSKLEVQIENDERYRLIQTIKKKRQPGQNLQNAYLRGAILTGAILTGAILSGANLESAKLESANLKGANLKRAYLSHADLSYANLYLADLVGVYLRDTNLIGINFIGSNLRYANLIDANLIDANLRDANLIDANLRDANLKRVQALATNFANADLTGACIEDWNINSQTNLQHVKCDYIYLKGNYSEEEKRWIFSDRRPHDYNKIFAPGEFSQLFVKALETKDLIFSEGIEWTAFLDSFQKLQAEVKGEELAIQAIEKKSGGAFVVRLEVPQEANKAEIEKFIKQEYEVKLKVIEANYQKQLQAKDETIQAKNEELIKAYREKNADILELVKIISSQQITRNIKISEASNISEASIISSSGKVGIGHNEGDISGGALTSIDDGLNEQEMSQDSEENSPELVEIKDPEDLI